MIERWTKKKQHVMWVSFLLVSWTSTSLAQELGGEPVSVGVDVSGIDEERFEKVGALTLLRRLVLRLTEEGFTVKQPEAQPDILLTLEAEEEAWVVLGVSDSHQQRRRVVVGELEVESIQLAIEHTAVDLARQLQTLVLASRRLQEEGASAANDKAQESRAKQSAEDIVLKSAPAPSSATRLMLGGGVATWGAAWMPALSLHVEHQRELLVFGGQLEALWTREAEVEVQEFHARLHAGLAMDLFEGTTSVSLSAGAILYRYSFVAEGTLPALSAGFHLMQRWTLDPGLSIGLEVATILSSIRFRHEQDGGELTTTPLLRFRIAAFVGWQF